jgi:hypothetical protein
MEGRVVESNGILSVAPARSVDLVKGGHAIAGLELEHFAASLFHNAGDVVARVGRDVPEARELPVLGVGPTDGDFDENLIIAGFGYRGVDDLDRGSYCRSVLGSGLVLSLSLSNLCSLVPLSCRRIPHPCPYCD